MDIIAESEVNKRGGGEERGERTIESSLIPLALPHADMTKASLKAMKMMLSTPLALSCSRLARYEVTCCSWQVGVKAPGTETRTTFLVANSGCVLLVPCLGTVGTYVCVIGVERDDIPLLASYLVGRPHTVRSRVPVGWT